MKIVKPILQFLFPENAVCIGCGDLSGAAHDGLCEDCLERLEKLRVTDTESRCPRCLSPLRRGACRECAMLFRTISRATFAFTYASPVSDIVKRYKYNGVGHMAEWMARQLLRAPGAKAMLRRCNLIVCAPSDVFRKNRRGYNQAYLLAKALGRRAGKPAADILKRRPFVKHQARLNRAERLANLSDVIHCGKDLSGKRILLVDDVRTTGATAAACARALREAGAERVELLTFAASEGKKRNDAQDAGSRKIRASSVRG